MDDDNVTILLTRILDDTQQIRGELVNSIQAELDLTNDRLSRVERLIDKLRDDVVSLGDIANEQDSRLLTQEEEVTRTKKKLTRLPVN